MARNVLRGTSHVAKACTTRGFAGSGVVLPNEGSPMVSPFAETPSLGKWFALLGAQRRPGQNTCGKSDVSEGWRKGRVGTGFRPSSNLLGERSAIELRTMGTGLDPCRGERLPGESDRCLPDPSLSGDESWPGGFEVFVSARPATCRYPAESCKRSPRKFRPQPLLPLLMFSSNQKSTCVRPAI